MPLTITITLESGRARDKVRGLNGATKRAMRRAMVALYWRQYLPKHFTKQAYYRYPQTFKKRYQVERKRGRDRARQTRTLREPMVWTGRLRRNVLASFSPIGTVARMRGPLRGSSIANLHTGSNRRTGGYDMPAELRVVTESEIKAILGMIEDGVMEFLNRGRRREVIKISGEF